MKETSNPHKFLLGGLLAGFFVFSLFVPVFQAQAAVGTECTSDSGCASYSCRSATDNPATLSIEGGFCTGPCTVDSNCSALVVGGVSSLGWGGAKCTGSPVVTAVSGTCAAGTIACGASGSVGTCATGTACTSPAVPISCTAGSTNCIGGTAAAPAVNGVCLETPRSGSSLPGTAPATTGAGLLTLVDTITNWVFAIFTVLAIIFILLAAFQFVTAGGEATKVGEARQKLIWAMVGIIVAMVSKGLVPVIRAIVGG